jgi:hypothetical protein
MMLSKSDSERHDKLMRWESFALSFFESKKDSVALPIPEEFTDYDARSEMEHYCLAVEADTKASGLVEQYDDDGTLVEKPETNNPSFRADRDPVWAERLASELEMQGIKRPRHKIIVNTRASAAIALVQNGTAQLDIAERVLHCERHHAATCVSRARKWVRKQKRLREKVLKELKLRKGNAAAGA